MLVAFDVETTGLNYKENHIIQIGILTLNDELTIIKEFKSLIRPADPNYIIETAAQEIHGITKEALKDAPTFKDLSKKLLEIFGDNDIITYNGNTFDIKFLYNEFERIGIEFNLNRKFYDVYDIEKYFNSNKLCSTFERYFGKTMEESGLQAHDAMSDIIATVQIFSKQLNKIKQSEFIIEDISNTKIECIDSFLQKDKNNKWIFEQGKYKLIEVTKIFEKDPGYIKWIMTNNDISLAVKRKLQDIYKQFKNN